MLEIANLDSNKLTILQKVLSIFENSEYISIYNGEINNTINTNIVNCNLKSLLGETFCLDIVNPKKINRLLKTINKSNVKLYDDTNMNRYIISNNEVKIFCPKKAKSKNIDISEVFNQIKPIGNKINITSNKKLIKSLIGSNIVNLLINDSALKGLLIEETGIYNFPEYEDDDINEDNCEILISYGFLNIDSDEYDIQLGINDNQEYWLYTGISVDEISNISILENVKTKTMDNILI